MDRVWKLTDLGTGPSWFSEALAVNQRGQAAGYIGDAGSGYPVNSAFSWSKGRMTDLGAMGGDFSQAVGINDHGVIVGGSSFRSGTIDTGHAILWH